MKRMRPEQYCAEAHRRVNNMTADLVARFGVWNAEKIVEGMERELRNKRLGRDIGELS